MSFYARITGEINYADQSRLDAAVNRLIEDGWLRVADKKFVDEDDEVGTSESDVDGLCLYIPLGLYHNLTRALDDMVKGCASAHVVWTSTDGCFCGGVYEGEKETNYDLDKWAKENLKPEDQMPPDSKTDFDAYCEWMEMVEEEFFSAYGHP